MKRYQKTKQKQNEEEKKKKTEQQAENERRKNTCWEFGKGRYVQWFLFEEQIVDI